MPTPIDQLKRLERAELGIDGNAGFALLGADLQEGEAEFEPIKCSEPAWTAEYYRQSKIAINRAFARLQSRIGRRTSYRLGPSHPDYLS